MRPSRENFEGSNDLTRSARVSRSSWAKLAQALQGLPVSALIAEFQLDPLKDYLARNRELQDALRAGAPVPELTPPYGAREQWV